jgi:hypothetical protein
MVSKGISGPHSLSCTETRQFRKKEKKVLRNNNYLEVTIEKAKESPTSF